MMNTKQKMVCRRLAAIVACGILVTVGMTVVVVNPPPVKAWATPPPCDFLTGGGFILHFGAHANFGVGGGCKQGSPTWGHLEYIDHGTGLNVHWTSITGYFFVDDGTGTDPQTGQPNWNAGHLRNGQDKPVR